MRIIIAHEDLRGYFSFLKLFWADNNILDLIGKNAAIQNSQIVFKMKVPVGSVLVTANVKATHGGAEIDVQDARALGVSFFGALRKIVNTSMLKYLNQYPNVMSCESIAGNVLLKFKGVDIEFIGTMNSELYLDAKILL